MRNHIPPRSRRLDTAWAVFYQVGVVLGINRVTDQAQSQVSTAGLGAWQVDREIINGIFCGQPHRAISSADRAALHTDTGRIEYVVELVEFALLGLGRDRIQIARARF
ncbi:hypothetical protein D3C77_394640 [compost metagenome]